MFVLLNRFRVGLIVMFSGLKPKLIFSILAFAFELPLSANKLTIGIGCESSSSFDLVSFKSFRAAVESRGFSAIGASLAGAVIKNLF